MKKIIFVLMSFGPFIFIAWASTSCNSSSENAISDSTTVSSSITPDTSKSRPDIVSSNTQLMDTTVELIKKTLVTQLLKNDINLLTEADRKFTYSQSDLNQDGKNEIFVRMQGSYFCGNAGCTAYLLADDGKKINAFTIVQGPIRVSKHVTKEWSDLIINSRGIDYLMKFNGKSYPSNPSIQPKFSGNAASEVRQILPDSAMVYNF